MIYFTADLHLGHANVIKHCDRPFTDVTEMDEALIANWNKRVHKNDTVYIVGDFIFRAEDPEGYLKGLKGEKHLIVGNHDNRWMRRVDMDKYFASVELMRIINDGKRKITLCHYPMMSWNGMNRGYYMIYGHVHNNKGAFYLPLLKQIPNALNAGVDVNNFTPVTFDELVENNEVFREVDDLMAEIEEIKVKKLANGTQPIFDSVDKLFDEFES
jgi:calcineurin-like phosphoesterase family protein